MDNFSWVKNLSLFNKDFTQKCNARRNGGYFLEVQYPEKFTWASRWFVIFAQKHKNQKAEKPIAHLHDKKEYMIHIRNWKQALNHGLVLKKFTESLNSIKKLG